MRKISEFGSRTTFRLRPKIILLLLGKKRNDKSEEERDKLATRLHRKLKDRRQNLQKLKDQIQQHRKLKDRKQHH